jgi:outer membrane protein assembly factor BamB
VSSHDGLWLVVPGAILRGISTATGKDVWNSTQPANGNVYEVYGLCYGNNGVLYTFVAHEVPVYPYIRTSISAFSPDTGELTGPLILPNKTNPVQNCSNQSSAKFQGACVGWGGVAVSPDGVVAIGYYQTPNPTLQHGDDADGWLSAVNLTSNAPLWTVLTVSDIKGESYSVLITVSRESKMIFAAPATGNDLHDGKIICAYSVADGNLVWQYTGVDTFTCLAVTTWDIGTLIAGNVDGHIYALDMGTGAIKWIFETGGSVVYGARVSTEMYTRRCHLSFTPLLRIKRSHACDQ